MMARLSSWIKRRSEAAVDTALSVPAVLRALVESWAVPRRERERLVRGLKPISNQGLALGSVLLVVLVAIIQYRYASHLSFSLFYLLVVAFAGWSTGRKYGMLLALVTAAAIFVVSGRMPENRSHPAAFWWDMWLQCGVLVAAAFIASAVRHRIMIHDEQMRERTAALEREINERKLTEEQLRKTTQQFRQLAENITDAFWMRDASESRMGYVSPAYETIWGRTCRELYQSPKIWLEAIHPEDRDRVAGVMRSIQSIGEYHLEYRIVRPDGALRWIRDRAFPIRDSTGKLVRVVGIAEDVTVRRRLEREILEISDREQARIGQDLHDGLCQKLVSLAFDNNTLEERLVARSVPETTHVQKMAELLDELITEARAVSRGLFPVQLETNGLALALQQLAATTSVRARLDCSTECQESVTVSDNVMATHLYRIAQEAVNNAVKHSGAGSIKIRLARPDDRIELTITDDGVGIPASAASASGMGLHTMSYRARTIGGQLTVGRASGRGTIVKCAVRQPAG